ncbi:MAG: hypothetical protein Q4P08_01870, partial [Eubacteriales bacterium]|nr:hypothetical protein [Eubacteriales bacterium]
MYKLCKNTEINPAKKRQTLLAGALALVFLFNLLFSFLGLGQEVVQATEDPWTEILRIKEEQEEISKQKEILEAEIAVFQDEEAIKNSEYAWILERSQEEREKYLTRVNQLYRVYLTMESVKLSLAQAIEVFEQKKAQYGERIATMFQMQQKSLLELFLEAETLEGFFTTVR